MKIVRFTTGGKTAYGLLEGEQIRTLAADPFSDAWNAAEPLLDGGVHELKDVRLLVPCEPTKYLGVGLNFSSAAAQQGKQCPDYPITFLKPTGAIIGTGDSIILPREEDCFCFEGELAVVIGKLCSHVSAAEAKDYILGYTCSNDVTDMGSFGKDDLKLKAADTFGPVGPCISTEPDPRNCVIRSWLNGKLQQEGNTSEMKFDVFYMIEFISSYMTLYPGDVISMGTPAGFAHIRPGDEIVVEVEGVGKLVNRVK